MEKYSLEKAQEEPKKILKSLEAIGEYLFHGSPDGEIKALEPRQGRHVPNKEKPTKTIADGSPAVSATPYADVAIFRAIINNKNIPFSHSSSFAVRGDSLEFGVSTEDALEEAMKNKNGFVYVFDRKDFEPYDRDGGATEKSMEWRSYNTIKPVKVIEVSSQDIIPRDNISIG